jgi:hypothetical protein
VKPPKPPINTGDFNYSEDWAKDFKKRNYAVDKTSQGSVGWVEGTLANPVVAGHIVLEPNKSQVALPGGILTLSTGIVDARFPLFPTGPDDKPKMVTNVEATGDLEGHRIAAKIEGDLLKEDRGVRSGMLLDDPKYADRGRLPITFTELSTPSGAAPLSSDEIYSRLVGVTLLVDALERRDPNDPWAEVKYQALGWGLRDITGKWVRNNKVLDSFSLNLDPARAPEATFITKPYTHPRLGSFRLGVTTGFGTPQTWKAWTDYQLPNLRLFRAISLRDFSLSANINDQKERGVSLQWRREF